MFSCARLIQGAQGHSVLEVGIGMLSLSLGWSLGSLLLAQIESLLHPEVRAMLPERLHTLLQESVAGGVTGVFWAATISTICCLVLCLFIPAGTEMSTSR